jgi:hypothetical protein
MVFYHQAMLATSAANEIADGDGSVGESVAPYILMHLRNSDYSKPTVNISLSILHFPNGLYLS